MAATTAGIMAAVVITLAVGYHDAAADKSALPIASSGSRAAQSVPSSRPSQAIHASIPSKPGAYVGVYVPGVPASYAGLTTFTHATGIRPNLVSYYSGWMEPFQSHFAATVARHGAVPLVQIDPADVSVSAIASGSYDAFLRSYAIAVRSYRRPVILSFGHEMNATWYQWGNGHTSPAAFVAAWRHIVSIFRAAGANNVTWLWTINIIDPSQRIASPAPWWPGRSYVTWVGIDGYYSSPSETFANLFGSTIVAVRGLTSDPVLVSETGVAPIPNRLTEISNLFAGIHVNHLLGLLWFDASGSKDWRLDNPSVTYKFRQEVEHYRMGSSKPSG